MKSLFSSQFSALGKKAVMVCAMVGMLAPMSVSADNLRERPTAGEMVADIVVARPLLVVATVAGTGIYLVTLPFTLAGGNAGQAGKELVVEPAKNTFVRCLGCRQGGYNR